MEIILMVCGMHIIMREACVMVLRIMDRTSCGLQQSCERRAASEQQTRGFIGSGGGIRTHGLRVMSPTSYQTALPRAMMKNVCMLTR